MSTNPRRDIFKKEQSQAEGFLWDKLRDGVDGETFRHQVAVGPYTADFLCLNAKLIVDVAYTHSDNKRAEAREKVLATLGYKIHRVKDADILADPDAAAKDVAKALAARKKELK